MPDAEQLLQQALECAEQIRARQTYFTHMAYEIMHEPTDRQLPEGMALAHDGLRLSLEETEA